MRMILKFTYFLRKRPYFIETCDGDYLIVRNGDNRETSPMMLIHPGQSRDQQNGRLCGTQRPARWNTTSNVMSVQFHSDGSNAGSGFRMYYKQTDFGCGGSVRLSDDEPETYLTSLNYPNVPPPHAECVWFVIAPTEHRIQVDFVEQFDIRPTGNCVLAGVELKDGGTDFSPSIGTFCNDRPPTQRSSSNVMRMKYYTNSDRPNLGFKAKVSIATCGGTVHVTSNSLSSISSPNYPANYPRNANCSWTIIGPEGHYLRLNFNAFNMPFTPNCSLGDRVEILEPNVNRTGFELTRTLCGTSRISSMDSLTNVMKINFISTSDGPSNLKGFMAMINASIESMSCTCFSSEKGPP